MSALIDSKSNRDEIKKLQIKLQLTPDGQFGPLTAAAVRNFQTKNNLPVTGIVDYETHSLLFPPAINANPPSSDLSETFNSKSIKRYSLPKNEYYQEDTVKKSIFIHHTAGWNNPFNVVDSWARDTRGRIGTHYVIGGINPVSGDVSYDGVILQTCDDSDWIHHLGVKNSNIDKYSIGIELCNFGYLTKQSNSYMTYTNTAILNKHVCVLNEKFRSYQYWHDYSDKQLNSLKMLIQHLCDKHDIDINSGLKTYLKTQTATKAFEFKQSIITNNERGIFSHSNVRKDKFDCYPNTKLTQLLLNL